MSNISAHPRVEKPILQTTNSVLMVKPSGFIFDPDAASDNYFMQAIQTPAVTETACQEFTDFVDILHKAALQVQVIDPLPNTPNAVFPNNVFSTHAEGGEKTLVLYPMRPLNRRLEQQAIFPALKNAYSRIVDLTYLEQQDLFLESTGCLVLDRINRIAYVSLSERAHLKAIDIWAEEMGYRTLTFASNDARGKTIYHTNVMMSVGTHVAILCKEAITEDTKRRKIIDSLQSSGRTIVDISFEQLDHFCGNVIELADHLVMSTRAFHAFTAKQRETFYNLGLKITHAPLTMIENVGGGSARCCLGELF